MREKIFTAVFLVITLSLYPAYMLTYDMWDHTNYENRNYTTLEDVKNAPLSEKSGVIDNFINDNAPFKNELTSLNAGINYKLFKTIQSGEVLMGKDGWLFHKNAADSSAIDDYQGLNPYSEAQLARLTEKLEKLEDILKEKDIRLKIIVPPNKEQVYSRYMPEDIAVIATGRVKLLADYINDNSDVCFVYPLETFKSLSDNEHIYYKYDTHWNNLGALRGIQLILDGFENSYAYETDEKPLMDLANASGIYNYVDADKYYTADANTDYTGEKLHLLHDSFGDMMIPVLSQRYSVTDNTFAYFSRFNIPEDTDIFVIEITERYIYRIFDTIDRIIENAEKL